MSAIANKLAKLRADRKWTLKKLSAMTGISVSHLSAMEKGTRPNPSFQYIVRLSAAFRVPLEHFVEWEALTEEGNALAPTGAHSESEQEDLLNTIERIYDADTRAFIAAEQSRPYITLARQLANQGDIQDPSSLLQLIAQFMRERAQSYGSP